MRMFTTAGPAISTSWLKLLGASKVGVDFAYSNVLDPNSAATSSPLKRTIYMIKVFNLFLFLRTSIAAIVDFISFLGKSLIQPQSFCFQGGFMP
jgi:hypothetical protein